MDKRTQKIIRNYFKSKPVEKAWVFGSFARGEETPNRPVDLVVDGNLLPFASESANKDKILVYERAN